MHERAAVIVAGSRIAQLMPASELPRAIATHVLPDGAWLAPGFIDLQVNGGADVLFNDQPSAAGLRAIAAAHRKFGTTGLLPTLLSDSMEKMRLALDIVDAVVTEEPGILGVHLEGPYLSPEKPGVHDRRHIRRPGPDDLALLTAPRNGVLLVTLAPEVVAPGFIAQLVAAGVRVSLGHSMATYQQTARRHGRRTYRIYASLQCDATAGQPGAGTDRAGAGIRRCLVRPDRRWRARRSRHAAPRLARASDTRCW